MVYFEYAMQRILSYCSFSKDLQGIIGKYNNVVMAAWQTIVADVDYQAARIVKIPLQHRLSYPASMLFESWSCLVPDPIPGALTGLFMEMASGINCLHILNHLYIHLVYV